MAKYTEQFKFHVVSKILAREAGAKVVAKSFGLRYSMVERWVAQFQQHGLQGLARKTRVSHTPEQKLAVLEHMWKEGLSYVQVSALYDIRSPSMVPLWEQQYHAGGIGALAPKPRERPSPMPKEQCSVPPPPYSGDRNPQTHAELLKENEYLRAEVDYLKKLKALTQGVQSLPYKKCK